MVEYCIPINQLPDTSGNLIVFESFQFIVHKENPSDAAALLL